jgi:CheY-like chemotaxis protein
MARVLIVDDEPLTIELLSSYLSLIGHQPITAYYAQDAWTTLHTSPVDLILLDIMLPDGNGLEICRALRQQPNMHHLPVLMISAYHPPMETEAYAAGANAYMQKPLKLDALKHSIEEMTSLV